MVEDEDEKPKKKKKVRVKTATRLVLAVSSSPHGSVSRQLPTEVEPVCTVMSQ